MRIGDTAYGIHGTNVRWSIGRLATHGCVRLYERDIQELFARTPEGTPLTLVYQPYKWGRDGRTLLFEAHPDLYDRTPARLAAALVLPRALGLLPFVDVEAVWQAVEASRGEPVPVGTLPSEERPTPASTAPTFGSDSGSDASISRPSS
jgi:L,D-transpeptidase ErfK/SrfK